MTSLLLVSTHTNHSRLEAIFSNITVSLTEPSTHFLGQLVQWNHANLGQQEFHPLTTWAAANVVIDKYILCSQAKQRKLSRRRHGPWGDRPYSRWQIDFHGPLPPSAGASRIAVIIIDTYTGLLLATPTRNSSISLLH